MSTKSIFRRHSLNIFQINIPRYDYHQIGSFLPNLQISATNRDFRKMVCTELSSEYFRLDTRVSRLVNTYYVFMVLKVSSGHRYDNPDDLTQRHHPGPCKFQIVKLSQQGLMKYNVCLVLLEIYRIRRNLTSGF